MAEKSEGGLTSEAKEYIRNYLGKWIGLIAGVAGIANLAAVLGIYSAAKTSAAEAASVAVQENQLVSEAVKTAIQDGLDATKAVGELRGELNSLRESLVELEGVRENLNEILKTTEGDPKIKLINAISDALKKNPDAWKSFNEVVEAIRHLPISEYKGMPAIASGPWMYVFYNDGSIAVFSNGVQKGSIRLNGK